LSQSAKDQEKARKARLAAALRANLRKRKDQARTQVASIEKSSGDALETRDDVASFLPQKPSSQG